jgi:hypothetical protein
MEHRIIGANTRAPPEVVVGKTMLASDGDMSCSLQAGLHGTPLHERQKLIGE